MAAAFAELGFTAVHKLSDRYHDRVYEKAGKIPRGFVKRTRRRASSQPARQAVVYEHQKGDRERPRELKNEDWEVADDRGDPGPGLGRHAQRRPMDEAPYGRSGSADAGYDQRGPPAYENYSGPPQAARGPQEEYARAYQGDMRNYDPAVAAAAGGAAAYAGNYAADGRKSYDDYYRRGSDEYSYSNPDRRDPYDRRFDDRSDDRGDKSHSRYREQSRGRKERKSKRDTEKSRPRSPSAFRKAMDDNFDTSEKGAAAGIAGALVGGLAGKKFGDDSMLATLVGAAVGGIGANALEHQWKKRQDLKEGSGRKKDSYRQSSGGAYDDEKYDRRRRRSR